LLRDYEENGECDLSILKSRGRRKEKINYRKRDISILIIIEGLIQVLGILLTNC